MVVKKKVGSFPPFVRYSKSCYLSVCCWCCCLSAVVDVVVCLLLLMLLSVCCCYCCWLLQLRVQCWEGQLFLSLYLLMGSPVCCVCVCVSSFNGTCSPSLFLDPFPKTFIRPRHLGLSFGLPTMLLRVGVIDCYPTSFLRYFSPAVQSCTPHASIC